ncbi:hypothetical protein CLIB1423_25S00474 [[Candida] railenensis]|uniref:Zn(2)-C6 fungal-type domain-containing protein n=1 Tax=[Candida] railenensis TaxID=45579 RepID=A0A9P0QUL5_9ASCO|nr:hypothetical protein CLIB1423_25S00474 [[Candida] railenensis]
MSSEQKKSRVKQACNFCRSRKAKCDGKLPHCTACNANPEKCVYSTLKKRRGLPSGYTHDLEKKVLVFQALISYIIRDKSQSTNLSETLEKCLIDIKESKTIVENIDSLQIYWDDSRLSNLIQNFIKANGESIHIAKRSSRGLRNIIKTEDDGEPLVENNNYESGPLSSLEKSDGYSKLTDSMATSSSIAYNSAISNSLFNLNTANENGQSNSGLASSNYKLIDDPSAILKDEIFPFVSDELDAARKRDFEDRDSWTPIALQFHGLSTLISGFTSRSIKQYSSTLNLQSKRPFSVGSIFNISSPSITSSIDSNVKLPQDILNFPNEIAEIVECYFQVYHPWCPMLNRVFITRLVHRIQALKDTSRIYQQNISTFKPSECNLLALIWATITLGKMVTNVSNTSKDKEVNHGDEILCATYAKNCIKSLENSPTTSIETIQSMILLGIFNYQTGNWDRSWTLISSATRMAIDVRLMLKVDHKNENNKNISPSDWSERKTPSDLNEDSPGSKSDLKLSTWEENSSNATSRERTWGCVYMMNTILSSRMGREPLVKAIDWPIPLISEDGWEEWEGWTSYHSPRIIKLDSGRFLSIFNQLMQVISLWNFALTCIIDVSEDTLIDDQDDNDIYKIPRPMTKNGRKGQKNHVAPNRQTLAYFQSNLHAIFKAMPEYCKLENFPDMVNVPPFLSFLHLSKAMVWCILSIRLSALKSSMTPTIKDEIVELRNTEYTKSISVFKKIINTSTLSNLKDYPFIDYFALMAVAFPKMIDFKDGDDAELRTHTKIIEKLFIYGATISYPFKLTLDVYNINKGFDKDHPSNSNNKRKGDESNINPGIKLLKLTSGGVLGRAVKEDDEFPMTSSGAKTSITSLLNYKRTIPVASRRSSSSISPSSNTHLRLSQRASISSGKNRNIDSFMLDLDLNKSIEKQKDFAEHMGYVSQKNGITSNGQGMAVYSNELLGGSSANEPIPQLGIYNRNTMHSHISTSISQQQQPHIQRTYEPPAQFTPGQQYIPNRASLNNAMVPVYSPYRPREEPDVLEVHFNNVFNPGNGLNAFLYHTLSKNP